MSICESPLVEEGVQIYMEAKKNTAMGVGRPYSDPGGYLTVDREVAPPQPSPEKSWKWSGTDFIKSPTEEPWVRGLCLGQIQGRGRFWWGRAGVLDKVELASPT